MLKKIIGAIFAITIITHWRWFFNFSILSYGDWGFFFQEIQKEFLNLPFGWLSTSFGEAGIVALPMYPVNLLWGLLSFVTDFSFSERILYFFPSILFGAFGSFFLVRKVTGSQIGAFVGSLVFTYNTYFLLG